MLGLKKVTPGTTWSKQLPLGFGVICEISTAHGLSLGEVHFDLEKYPEVGHYHSASDLAEQTASLSISSNVESQQRWKSSFLGLAKGLRGRSKNDASAGPSSSSTKPVTTTNSPPSLWALFLDSSVCLVLRPRATGYPAKADVPPTTFERVGIGNFLRTESQIGMTDPKNFNVGDNIAYGPITQQSPRTQVTIN